VRTLYAVGMIRTFTLGALALAALALFAAPAGACSREQVRTVQRTLADGGYDPGPLDGALGPRTRAAIRAWQRDGKLEATGRLGCEPPEARAETRSRDRGGREVRDEARRRGHGRPETQPSARPEPPTVPYKDGRYRGGMQGGVPHGQGVMIWPDGRTYTGAWRRGRFDGKGAYVAADGSAYTGEFADGVYAGEGVLSYRNGPLYRGSFRDGRPDGPGVLRTAEGEFRGDWDRGCLVDGGRPTAFLAGPEGCPG